MLWCWTKHRLYSGYLPDVQVGYDISCVRSGSVGTRGCKDGKIPVVSCILVLRQISGNDMDVNTSKLIRNCLKFGNQA